MTSVKCEVRSVKCGVHLGNQQCDQFPTREHVWTQCFFIEFFQGILITFHSFEHTCGIQKVVPNVWFLPIGKLPAVRHLGQRMHS